jgi:antagonist of KipI
MIVVERAPAYLTVQDSGRPAFRASGVPHAGAMDQWSLAIANILVGNHLDAAALEWAVGGGTLRFDQEATIALVGAETDATIDDEPVEPNARISIRAGQRLSVSHIKTRRFLYVAVSGGVDCPRVLGSRSTYQPAGFGGVGGRRLARGDVIPIRAHARVEAPMKLDFATSAVGPDYDSEIIRVISTARSRYTDGATDESPGERFAPPNDGPDAGALESFLRGSYTVSQASDRTGYRLDAAPALDQWGASVTSEPVCAGAIQLPAGGHPIVLMADSPTIGGYRIIGTVISCDLPIVSQCVPGRTLRFERVSVSSAQEELRSREQFLQNIASRVADPLQ